MTDQRKKKVVSVVGFCGGGVFLVLNIITNGAVPGGFVGGVLGFLVFGGLAAFVVYVLMPKEQSNAPGSSENPSQPGGADAKTDK